MCRGVQFPCQPACSWPDRLAAVQGKGKAGAPSAADAGAEQSSEPPDGRGPQQPPASQHQDDNGQSAKPGSGDATQPRQGSVSEPCSMDIDQPAEAGQVEARELKGGAAAQRPAPSAAPAGEQCIPDCQVPWGKPTVLWH